MKANKFEILFGVLIFILLILLVASARGQQTPPNDIVLTGGGFTMTKTVVAGGGRTTGDVQTSAAATAGQTVAGNTSTGGQFSLYTGFWTPDAFEPTAATVNVGGRVSDADGRGIVNAVITVVFPSGERRTARSGIGGRFRLSGIPAGDSYIFTITTKHFVFASPSRLLTIDDDRDDIDFVAEN